MKKIILLMSFLLIGTYGLFAGGDVEKDDDKEFVFASNGTFTHFDPHNSNTTQQVNLYEQVYESLTGRDENFVVQQGLGLSESWELLSDTQWKFVLKKGIKFHNGADFTAEDVVASLERAQKGTEGTISIAKNLISGIDVLTDYEIIVNTNGYVPVLPSAITSLLIMDKGWIEDNNALIPLSSQDATKLITVDQANGTGPYKLVSLVPNESIVFEINADYWNIDNAGSVRTFKYITIDQSATSIAALISGEVDLVFPVPIQDWDRVSKTAGIDLHTGIESRPIFLGLDQHRDTLLGAEDGATDNPFKDKRVREAVNLAIDIETINEKIMLGQALPIGILSAPGLGGHPTDRRLNAPYPYNLNRAKELLKEAGYENGFSVIFDAPNNRYLNDEAIAQSITSMLAKVNIDVTLKTQPRNTYFGQIFNDRDTSVYMLGWHPVASHDYDIVTRLLASPTEGSPLGSYNIGQFRNQKLTEIAEQIGKPENNDKFDSLIADAYRIAKEEFAYVPLLAPPLSIAINNEYEVKVFPDDEISFVNIHRKK